jgi:hypothetical protein
MTASTTSRVAVPDHRRALPDRGAAAGQKYVTEGVVARRSRARMELVSGYDGSDEMSAIEFAVGRGAGDEGRAQRGEDEGTKGRRAEPAEDGL